MTRSSDIQLYLPGILNAYQHWHRDYAVEINTPNLLQLMQTCSSVAKAQCDYREDLYQHVLGKPFSLIRHYAASCYEADFSNAAPEDLYLASPINLESGLTSLTVAPHVIDDIQQEDWLEMCAALNGYFAPENWHFLYSKSGRLYVQFPEKTPPDHIDSVEAILGKNLLDIMDTQGVVNWHARLNEIQMLLFSLPFNQQREANRQLLVNGLWIWGGGSSRFDQTARSVDYVLGGGAEGEAVAHHTSAHFHDTYSEHVPLGKGIIIADDCLPFYQAGDIDAWQNRLHQLDETLFARLVDQLKNISLIHSCNGFQWRPKKKSLLHFFQKKRSKITDFLIEDS